MTHHVKTFTLKFNARRMCLSRRTDMLPFIRQEEPYKQHVSFLTLVAGSPEPNCSNTIIILPWLPETIVSPLPLRFILL